MTEPAADPGTPPPGSYALDPARTTVRADVKAMFGLFTVHGTFRLKDGQVSIAAEPGESGVRASLDAASYASGNAKRDADVRSPGLLDARGFPDIVFTGRGARRDGADWLLTGSVTAHGTPVQAQVRVTGVSGLRAGGEAPEFVRFQATARLDRTSFGITRKKGLVGRMVTVVIETVGQPA
jgi:polyisoprenoid-binding protein YceI